MIVACPYSLTVSAQAVNFQRIIQAATRKRIWCIAHPLSRSGFPSAES
jgi:hypothetical protein